MNCTQNPLQSSPLGNSGDKNKLPSLRKKTGKKKRPGGLFFLGGGGVAVVRICLVGCLLFLFWEYKGTEDLNFVCINFLRVFLHLIPRTKGKEHQNANQCTPPPLCSLEKTCQLEFNQKCVVSSPLSLQRKVKTDLGRTPIHSNALLHKNPTNTPHFSASPVSCPCFHSQDIPTFFKFLCKGAL